MTAISIEIAVITIAADWQSTENSLFCQELS
jgi:hypothetical protein